jgi:polyphosphate kinase 2 (PPK2 family)
MKKVNKWEDQQMEDGVELTKFYFSLSKNQQEIRMKARKNSELKYWKLSKNDEKIITKWNAFTLYKEQMFDKTSTDNNPWVSINSNNKMIARLTSLRYLLIKTEYEGKKILKPTKWSKSLNNYSTNLEGVNFDNLSYEQFIVLSKYTDS